MKRKPLVCCFVFIFAVLIFSSGQISGRCIRSSLFTSQGQNISLDAPDEVNAGQQFMVNITIRNDRLFPLRAVVGINLLDGVLQTIQKNISQEQHLTIPGRQSVTLQIPCLIRQGDTSWLEQQYNIQAVLYRHYPLLGKDILIDSSALQGLHMNNVVVETYKVVLKNISVPETITAGQHWFVVTADVNNQGSLDVISWVSVVLIEKPSAIPQLEQLGILKGFTTEVKEVGSSSPTLLASHHRAHTFTVNCSLRYIDAKKTQFLAQVYVYSLVDGMEYQSDVSSLYEVYHPQVFSLTDNIVWIVAVLFVVLLAAALIAVIIRIVIPYYQIKKMSLKKEKERIEKARKK